jgi:hypothetical protein
LGQLGAILIGDGGNIAAISTVAHIRIWIFSVIGHGWAKMPLLLKF